MIGNLKKYKSIIICVIIALAHWGITFATDTRVFDFATALSREHSGTAIMDYCLCKICALVVLVGVYLSIYAAIWEKSIAFDRLRLVFKCALPYLVVAFIVMLIKLPAGYISNDENVIYNNAITLTHDTWFYYITTYYYIISLMLIPFKYGPILVKVIIQLLTVGYVLARLKEYFGKRIYLCGYILFLLYPVIAYTTSAHRLPVYFLLYLILFTKLLFDGLEDRSLDLLSVAIISFLGAILTQWRTEGIYLALLIPILVFIAYKNSRNTKFALRFIIGWIVIQYLISVPQNGLTANNLDDAANDRMKPFYAYTITNMYRNGLDINKNAEDLAIVDKYMSLEVIKAINDYYGDINYEDVLILYQDGYIGVRPEASVEDFINYSNAVKRIFVNNPDVFVRTRIGAFCYAALPYRIAYTGMGIKELIGFGISLVKSVLYNLFIPFGLCIVMCVYSLIKRKWYSFFVFGGLLAHWFIVFVLAPASYFKYYFPIYVMAYFYLLILIMWAYRKRKGEALKCPLW